MAATPSSDTRTTEERIAGWLSPEEFTILETVCDTFFPSLEPPPGSSEIEAAYYRRKAADLRVALLLAETLAQENDDAQADFRRLLRLMASPGTSLVLVRSAKPFVALAQEQREKYLSTMANSPVAALRQGYQTLKRLSGFIYFSVPDLQLSLIHISEPTRLGMISY